jgi:hypothetical protein
VRGFPEFQTMSEVKLVWPTEELYRVVDSILDSLDKHQDTLNHLKVHGQDVDDYLGAAGVAITSVKSHLNFYKARVGELAAHRATAAAAAAASGVPIVQPDGEFRAQMAETSSTFEQSGVVNFD